MGDNYHKDRPHEVRLRFTRAEYLDLKRHAAAEHRTVTGICRLGVWAYVGTEGHDRIVGAAVAFARAVRLILQSEEPEQDKESKAAE